MISRFAPRMVLDESGQGIAEYAVLIALISVAAVAIMTTFGQKVNTTLSKAVASFS